jgi:hypothetical protein
LSSDICLNEKSKHGEHGQSSVLNFLNLQQRKLVRILC